MSTNRIRFLFVADSPGHTTGYRVVARALREAGVEVILAGFAQPEQIVETAIQEDVNWIGYRIMDREPLVIVSRLMDLLAEREQPQIRVMVGGIIARRDIPRLKALGVEAIFRPGARLEDIQAQVVGSAGG